MAEDTVNEFADAWRAGSTVFSARTLSGNEVLLWLVPRVDVVSFCEDRPVAHEVRFASMNPSPKPESPRSVELVPAWWVFESSCTPSRCSCGPRSLAEVLPMLPRRAAGQALAAHVDLLDALQAAPSGFAPAIMALRADLSRVPLGTLSVPA